MDRRITNSADVLIVVSVRAGMSPGTKKTTHPLDRRLALSTTVSTADAIRLPNGAEFCIRAAVGAIVIREECGGKERLIRGFWDIYQIHTC